MSWHNAKTKRFIDAIAASFLLVVFTPLIGICAFIIWLQDGNSPIFCQTRCGKHRTKITIFKLRSMTLSVNDSGIGTTSENDGRITKFGSLIRKLKIDELPQLMNVIYGDLSLVGPRPQTVAEANLYTEVEEEIFNAKPGMTDLASVVFSDLNTIVASAADPNVAYHQLVRPWKSRLALLYVQKSSLKLDICILGLTAICIFSSRFAARLASQLLGVIHAETDLTNFTKRDQPLTPQPPPGSATIITKEDIY